MARKVYVGASSSNLRGLPSGYTELEYIQSTGSQWIDTKVVGESTVSMEYKARLTGSTSGKNVLSEVYSSGSSTVICSWRSGGGKFQVCVGGSYQDVFASDQLTHEIKFAQGSLTVDGTAYPITGSASTTATIPLFAEAMNGSVQAYGSFALYSAKFYNNGTMVRDFIPCKNSSGTVGLYDMVNGEFYSNKGSGTFTAGSVVKEVITENVARKVKQIYVGVENKARRVKKAYIGIGGVARPFWGESKLVYYGTTSNSLSMTYYGTATSVGDYALFGGGNNSTKVEAFNKTLTKTTPTALNGYRNWLASTSVGDYALFGGGTASSVSSTVDAYNKSLTRTNPTALSVARQMLMATSVGNYALFAGGGKSSTYYNTVDAYDSSLTRTTPAVLSVARQSSTKNATSIGNYALFGGGVAGSDTSTVDAYNSSLTRTTPTALSNGNTWTVASTTGTHALFTGGYTSTYISTVDAYDKSLTKTSAPALSVGRTKFASANVDEFAIFGGGENGMKVVDAYNASLTRTNPTGLSRDRSFHCGTHVGNYALFGGGVSSSAPIDVYEAQ